MKISIKNHLTRLLVVLAFLVMVGPALVLGNSAPAQAVTTANITITVTPGVIGISCNASTLVLGTVLVNTTSNTSTSHFGITNSSTIEADFTIAVTGNTWTGGSTAWTHSDAATAGVDQCGMNSNRGGTWGTGDVVVKYASPNYIYEDCALLTDFDFGLSMVMPTSSTVNDQKTNVVQVTVAAS